MAVSSLGYGPQWGATLHVWAPRSQCPGVACAGAVVRRDVEPGAIVIGNPAQTVGSADAFEAKHRARQAAGPSYPSYGFSGYGEVTPENMERVRREIADGSGYVGY